MKISITKHALIFKRPAGTSRGILKKKNTWFIKVYDNNNHDIFGLGEINMFEGLSYDYRPDFYKKLKELELNPEHYLFNYHHSLEEYPAIRFGLETALLDYKQSQNRIIFPSDFVSGSAGIPINGLIWMGDKDFMKTQIKQKMKAGFHCLKMKIGALSFDQELQILQSIRNEFNSKDLELRVDANGAFHPSSALEKLEKLSAFSLHSIEQPIQQGNTEAMKELCRKTPIPIALDEELIGINEIEEKKQLLREIEPQYIILKPALTGGFEASQEWIDIAEEQNISWWITSALESNIGLNAIAQWTYQLNTDVYQGLGTGQLFTNNMRSPLFIEKDQLYYHPEEAWEINL